LFHRKFPLPQWERDREKGIIKTISPSPNLSLQGRGNKSCRDRSLCCPKKLVDPPCPQGGGEEQAGR